MKIPRIRRFVFIAISLVFILSCSLLLVACKDNVKENKTSYIVTFDTDGGSQISSQIVEKDNKATKPADPTKEGFAFLGWYLDKTGTIEYDFATPMTQDIAIYSIWGKYSEGLSYSLNSDYISYSATGIGTCTDTDIIIPAKYDGKPVTRIDEYSYFGDITSIVIPIYVNYISRSSFIGSPNIKKIIVDSRNTIYHSVGNCIIETSTQTLVLGCKNSVIPTDGSVTSIGNGAFYYCSSLTSITISDSVTSIGRGAFDNCTGLTNVTIGNGVTSIEDGAFAGCSALSSITIPDSVTSIGVGAFYECSSLESITYKGTKAQWSEITKGDSWDYKTGFYTIHCSDGDISK